MRNERNTNIWQVKRWVKIITHQKPMYVDRAHTRHCAFILKLLLTRLLQ